VENRNICRVLVRKPEGKRETEVVDVERVILKWMTLWHGLDSSGSK
jgi:hypothetical protein